MHKTTSTDLETLPTFSRLSLLVVLSCLPAVSKSEPLSLPLFPSLVFLPLFLSNSCLTHWNTFLLFSSRQADKQAPGWGAFFSFWHSVPQSLSASAMVQTPPPPRHPPFFSHSAVIIPFISYNISNLHSDSSFMINPIPCFSRRVSWKHRIHWRWLNVVSH